VRDEFGVLSALLAVADERSFTRAAKRLNVSTSAVSQAIRKLEEQIGVRLLTRTTVYFDSHPKPTSPRDVLNHQCIRFRHRGEGVYKWEFDKGDESLGIAVHGSLLRTNSIL
jgi:hypothetical protein